MSYIAAVGKEVATGIDRRRKSYGLRITVQILPIIGVVVDLIVDAAFVGKCIQGLLTLDGRRWQQQFHCLMWLLWQHLFIFNESTIAVVAVIVVIVVIVVAAVA